MTAPIADPPAAKPATRRLRLLHAASLQRSGGWIASALEQERPGGVDVGESVGVTATLARLREEAFDALVVSHEPGALEAADLVEALRTAGHDEPVVVLGDEPSPELETLCHEAGADAYCCVAHATGRSLLGVLDRAVRWRQVLRENRQLKEAERQRLTAEHREAEQALADQRRLVHELEAFTAGPDAPPPTDDAALRRPEAPAACDLPESLIDRYRGVLRAYVIMGGGNLSREMAGLSDLLAGAAVSADRVIQMHLCVLEELLGGLGNRSARHVMGRADLLALELVAQLADAYRRRYHERAEPCRQLTLPGFEPSATEPPAPARAA